MIALDISHDVIAAILGLVGIVTVAWLPLHYREARERKAEETTIRERIDHAIELAMSGQERRKGEHDAIIALLREIKELLQHRSR
jgi:hypothetical protein